MNVNEDQVKEIIKLGIIQIQQNTGKDSITIADAIESFLKSKTQLDAFPFLLVYKRLMRHASQNGRNFDEAVGQEGASETILNEMVKRFKALPEGEEDALKTLDPNTMPQCA